MNFTDSIKQNRDSFVAVDFETATHSRMVCQVGLTIVDHGKIIDTIVRLIQPPMNQYDSKPMAVHHITPRQTENEPTFDKVWEEIRPYFIGTTLVAHNAKFDENVLFNNLEHYGLSGEGIFPFECTYKIYNLPFEELCMGFNMPIEGHHDAGFDSRCCAQFYLNYLHRKQPYIYYNYPPYHKASFAKGMNEYHAERNLSSDVKKPLDESDVKNPNTPFFKQKIVITGIFTRFPERQKLAELLKIYGADINSSISRNTNIVIIGEDAGPKKLEKIEQLQEQGYDIKTYSEDELLAEFDRFDISY